MSTTFNTFLSYGIIFCFTIMLKKILIFHVRNFRFKLTFFFFLFSLYINLILFILYMIILVIPLLHLILECVWLDLVPTSQCSPLNPKVFRSLFHENLYTIAKKMPFDVHSNEVMHTLSLILKYEDNPNVFVEYVKSPELYSHSAPSKQAYADLCKCRIEVSPEVGILLTEMGSFECKSSYLNNDQIHSSAEQKWLLHRYNKSECIWFDFLTQDQKKRAEERLFGTLLEFNKLPIRQEYFIPEKSIFLGGESLCFSRLGTTPQIIVSAISDENKWDLGSKLLADNPAVNGEISQIIKSYVSKREPTMDLIQKYLANEVSSRENPRQLSDAMSKEIRSWRPKAGRFD